MMVHRHVRRNRVKDGTVFGLMYILHWPSLANDCASFEGVQAMTVSIVTVGQPIWSIGDLVNAHALYYVGLNLRDL